jgi:hypothetical protein
MSRARDLLDEPRSALTTLVGNVVTVENTISDYRKRLVENALLQRAHRGLEALNRATGAPAPTAITVKDVEDVGPLVAAQNLVSARIQHNAIAGDKQLAGAGVSFDRWCAIVAALDAGKDPVLETQEADALVKRNLVQRTYRLGVKS